MNSHDTDKIILPILRNIVLLALSFFYTMFTRYGNVWPETPTTEDVLATVILSIIFIVIYKSGNYFGIGGD